MMGVVEFFSCRKGIVTDSRDPTWIGEFGGISEESMTRLRTIHPPRTN
jgi:hypothetical protein